MKFVGSCSDISVCYKAIGVLAAMGLAVSACASVFEGRAQQIYVNTNPAGAECGFYREGGLRIATIQATPGAALIEKSKADIWVVCVKQGYEQAVFIDHSGVAGAAFANIIGGIFTLGISTAIGVAVDSSNGSDNKYESPVNVTMVPLGSEQAGAPVALPQTFTMAGPGQAGAQQAASVQTVGSSAGRTNNRPAGGTNHVASYAPPSSTAQPTPGQASNPLKSGVWVCGIGTVGDNADNYFTIQFAITDDHTITVATYANAPATVIRTDPLTFTAVNPRGSRLTTFVMKSDNTIVITGPRMNDPNSRFRNSGSCAKT